MKFNLKNFFKNPFNKKEVKKNTVSNEAKEAFTKIVLEHKNGKKTKKYKTKNVCEIQGYTFKIGDKVICRSNEPYPLLVGKIIEFWDNESKWDKTIPVVRNNRNGKKFNVHGVIRPYSQELMDTLRSMKPLEQWNYFVPEDVRYTEEQMIRKEESFKNREKIFLNKK